jgi:O-antigen ligase
MKSDFRDIRRLLAFFGLGAAVFVAPGLFGSVSIGPIMMVGTILLAAMLIAPVSSDATSLSPAVWAVVAAFAVVIATGVMQVWLTRPAGIETGDLTAEIAGRFASNLIPRSINPGRSEQMLGPILVSLAAFLLSARLASTPERAARIILIVAWVIFFWMVISLILFLVDPGLLLWTHKRAYRDSLTGPFVNRNTAATFFGTGILCLIALKSKTLTYLVHPRAVGLSNRGVFPDMALAAATVLPLVLLVLALVLTRSRAGILLSFAVAAFLFAGLCLSREIMMVVRRSRWRNAILILAAGLAVVLALIGFIDIAGERGTSDGGRLAVYGASLELMFRHPYWGVGLGGFPDAFPMVRPSALSNVGVWDRAHNTVLELGVEIGIPGMMIVVLAGLVVVRALFNGVVNRRRYPELPAVGLAVSGLAGLHSMVDFSLQIPGYAIPFFVILGASLAQAKSRSETAPSSMATPTAAAAEA